MYQDETFGRSILDECRVAGLLAARLRHSQASLSLRWLERIAARVNVAEEDVFPTQDLLDHVPMLVEAIADFLERPTEEGPTAGRVLAKAAELGQMRFEQGFSPYEILKEFELLGGIVLSFLARAADEMPIECPPGELMICAQRVHRALALIQQATAARYLAMLELQANEREQRLRIVKDLLAGPVRARLDETLSVARELPAEDATFGLRAHLAELQSGIEQIGLLSSIAPSARMQRNVPLRAAVAEAIRTLRDASNERGVDIRVPDSLPELEVNAGAVELAVMVFLTMLIKHGKPVRPDRYIEVMALGGGSLAGDSMVQVSVRDVGANLPDEVLYSLASARRQGETVTANASAGVGLTVAREAIESLGGRVSMRVENTTPAVEFVLELPSRRAEDGVPETARI